MDVLFKTEPKLAVDYFVTVHRLTRVTLRPIDIPVNSPTATATTTELSRITTMNPPVPQLNKMTKQNHHNPLIPSTHLSNSIKAHHRSDLWNYCDKHYQGDRVCGNILEITGATNEEFSDMYLVCTRCQKMPVPVDDNDGTGDNIL